MWLMACLWTSQIGKYSFSFPGGGDLIWDLEASSKKLFKFNHAVPPKRLIDWGLASPAGAQFWGISGNFRRREIAGQSRSLKVCLWCYLVLVFSLLPVLNGEQMLLTHTPRPWCSDQAHGAKPWDKINASSFKFFLSSILATTIKS